MKKLYNILLLASITILTHNFTAHAMHHIATDSAAAFRVSGLDLTKFAPKTKEDIRNPAMVKKYAENLDKRFIQGEDFIVKSDPSTIPESGKNALESARLACQSAHVSLQSILQAIQNPHLTLSELNKLGVEYEKSMSTNAQRLKMQWQKIDRTSFSPASLSARPAFSIFGGSNAQQRADTSESRAETTAKYAAVKEVLLALITTLIEANKTTEAAWALKKELGRGTSSIKSRRKNVAEQSAGSHGLGGATTTEDTRPEEHTKKPLKPTMGTLPITTEIPLTTLPTSVGQPDDIPVSTEPIALPVLPTMPSQKPIKTPTKPSSQELPADVTSPVQAQPDNMGILPQPTDPTVTVPVTGEPVTIPTEPIIPNEPTTPMPGEPGTPFPGEPGMPQPDSPNIIPEAPPLPNPFPETPKPPRIPKPPKEPKADKPQRNKPTTPDKETPARPTPTRPTSPTPTPPKKPKDPKEPKDQTGQPAAPKPDKKPAKKPTAPAQPVTNMPVMEIFPPDDLMTMQPISVPAEERRTSPGNKKGNKKSQSTGTNTGEEFNMSI